MKQLFLLAWLLMAARFSAAQPANRIQVTDLTRIKQIGGIQLAPTGSQALFVLSSIESVSETPGQLVPEYDYRTHIYLSNGQPNQAVALTRGPESARQACWSPDGLRVVFVRNVAGKPQLFVLPLGGGEAWQLTTLPYGATNPVFSPNGRSLLFTATVPYAEVLTDTLLNPGKRGPRWPAEKPGLDQFPATAPTANTTKPNPDGTLAEIRAYLAKDEADKKAKVITRLNFQGEATTEPTPSFQHLYVVDVQEKAAPRPLTRGFATYQAACWLPNGTAVLAVTDRDPTRHPDRELDNAIVAIAADGSASLSTVLGETGKSYASPQPAPDGSRLAYLVASSQGVGFASLGLANLTGAVASNPQLIPFDRAAGNLTWAALPAQTAAGRGAKQPPATYLALYFTANADGAIPLYRLDTRTNVVSRLTDLESGVVSFGVAADRLVFAKTEVADPNALYTALPDATQPQPLMAPNAGWLAGKTLSYPTKAVYTNTKGQAIDYWIMPPTALVPGRQYPLVLNMHGGPTAMWGPGEPSMWHEFQYLCAQGYGLVYANPRGSGGYGQAFQAANYRDWGTGPAEDVLAAATVAARQPWADTARQVITGGSYAGYLTAWIVAHDNRFKAAFAQRGVYDLTTFMGEGNAWSLVPNYFGLPWIPAEKAIIEANSPYSFVQNIKTPLLIKHGENDLRTGVIQSEMMYKSLKMLGRPVEYVRMPGATHELSRTGNVRQRIDRLLRIYEWFERFVGERGGVK